MYDNLIGKRLLLVGSNSADVAIVKVAHSLGMYVISIDGTSGDSRGPAKEAADEAWDIDYSDTNAVVERLKLQPVDGIIAGYSEYHVLAASMIAKEIGLPFYCSDEQVSITRNKRSFKDLCGKNGIPVPKDYVIDTSNPNGIEEEIEFPVIVKPVDYGGRKGISICRSSSELQSAVDYALSKSESKQIIIEEYLSGIEFSSVYTIVDGNYSLSCLNEKYLAEDVMGDTCLCDMVLSPAFFLDQYVETIDKPIISMLKSIGAKDGVANIQGIYTPNGLYVFEMGYRVNGNNDYNIIDYFNGINFMKMLINHSVFGTMGSGIERDNPRFEGYGITIVLNLHPGVISKISYDELKHNEKIFDIQVYKKIGDRILEDGTTAQKAVLVKGRVESLQEAHDLFDLVHDKFTILDEKGNNMIFKRLDFSKIEEYHTKR